MLRNYCDASVWTPPVLNVDESGSESLSAALAMTIEDWKKRNKAELNVTSAELRCHFDKTWPIPEETKTEAKEPPIQSRSKAVKTINEDDEFEECFEEEEQGEEGECNKLLTPRNALALCLACGLLAEGWEENKKKREAVLPSVALQKQLDYNVSEAICSALKRIVWRLLRGKKALTNCTGDELAIKLAAQFAQSYYGKPEQPTTEDRESVFGVSLVGMPRHALDGEVEFTVDGLMEDSEVQLLYETDPVTDTGKSMADLVLADNEGMCLRG